MISNTTAVILLMLLVTLATRLAGLWMMSMLPLHPRLQSFIQAMSASVLVAVVAPLALQGDWPARIGLSTTAVLMLTTGRTLWAIAAGIILTAVLRI